MVFVVLCVHLHPTATPRCQNMQHFVHYTDKYLVTKSVFVTQFIKPSDLSYLKTANVVTCNLM